MHNPGRIFFASLIVSIGVGCSDSGSSDSSTLASLGGSAATSGGASNLAGSTNSLPSAGAVGSSAGTVGSAGSVASATAGSNSGGESSTGGASGGASVGGSGGVLVAGAGGSNTGGTDTAGAGSGGQVDPGLLPNITIHLAGDSTMSNYAATTTQEGWGQELGQFFSAKVAIDNQALPGANVQSFYASSRWKTIMTNTKAGDFVMAAFGTNDSGTTHGPVSTADFGAEFTQMATEVAGKKATFVLTTPSPLQVWVNGKETNARLQPYCDVLIALGKSKSLLVDDLNARGVEYYNMIGETAAAALEFNGDKAHFNKAGATAMAMLAAHELTRIGSPLAAYLK